MSTAHDAYRTVLGERTNALNNLDQQSLFTKNNPSTEKILNHGKWSKEEDMELIDLVKQYGHKNWKVIAKHLGSRNEKQCLMIYGKSTSIRMLVC